MLVINGCSVYRLFILISALVAVVTAVSTFENEETQHLNKISACKNVTLQGLCRLKCGEHHACLLGNCFCLQPSTEDNNANVDWAEQQHEYDPALRHHVAHFCPDLEMARKCIQKCIRYGKPAFCGKDHVCYCGHKSDYPNDEEKIDTAGMYSQFKDLYAKYFGIQ